MKKKTISTYAHTSSNQDFDLYKIKILGPDLIMHQKLNHKIQVSVLLQIISFNHIIIIIIIIMGETKPCQPGRGM